MQEVTSVTKANIGGKRVVMRVDFNVPLKGGKILDDTRIRAALPTINYLHEQKAAAIILLAHVGRPEGKVVKTLSTAPIEKHLRTLTDAPFELRENLRFDPREEMNDPVFAQELARLGDIFVQDAFADAHREHASIVGITKLLPSYAGLLLSKEVETLTTALTPPKGAVAIIGGAKFETKEPLVEKLLATYDKVLLGGALGNDLLKARGMPFGSSLISSKPLKLTLAAHEHLFGPLDVVAEFEGVARNAFPADVRTKEQIVDIGEKTASYWSELISQAPFVLWNGPVGVYENGRTQGTDALAGALVKSTAHAVIGGGDTAAAVSKISFDAHRIFISTGGGAMLEFLTEGTLPGIEALRGRG